MSGLEQAYILGWFAAQCRNTTFTCFVPDDVPYRHHISPPHQGLYCLYICIVVEGHWMIYMCVTTTWVSNHSVSFCFLVSGSPLFYFSLIFLCTWNVCNLIIIISSLNFVQIDFKILTMEKFLILMEILYLLLVSLLLRGVRMDTNLKRLHLMNFSIQIMLGDCWLGRLLHSHCAQWKGTRQWRLLQFHCSWLFLPSF
jgi:hypothetical protein